MDFLRCKTPELVHKEIWTHVLAYNLFRTVMAQAAKQSDILPRSISFKGTLQALEAFQPLIEYREHLGAADRAELYQHLLHAVATHRVGDRPDRFEPRKVKRRPDAEVAKIVGMTREPPEAAVHDTAGVLRVGLKPSHLRISDRFKEQADAPESHSSQIEPSQWS